MAPNLLEMSPLKRTADDTGFDLLEPQKIKRRYHRHHRPHWRQCIDGQESSCDDNEAVQTQLIRGIALALEAVGFKHADEQALDKFRGLVEQCGCLCSG